MINCYKRIVAPVLLDECQAWVLPKKDYMKSRNKFSEKNKICTGRDRLRSEEFKKRATTVQIRNITWIGRNIRTEWTAS